MSFGNDLKMKEKIVFDRLGQLTHYHQERMEVYKLHKIYSKKAKGEHCA